MNTLRILSGGAAHGLVRALQPAFEAGHGCRVEGTFSAVGAIRDQLLAGAPFDLLILTEALVRELGGKGHVRPESARAVGVVPTGLAVRSGAQPPAVATAEELRACLQAAGGVYFPDPAKATAGIHFMKVLQALGLVESLATRIQTFPNGATAMGALAQSGDATAVGCTQVTEILATEGVQLVGLLPPPHELKTVYVGAVGTRAEQPALAQALLDALTAEGAAGERRKAGFD